jgi:DNA-binding response OmpR family regulator
MSDLPANSTVQNAKRILIVEDDPIVARIYQNRLTNAGFSVSVSAEGGDGFFCIVKDKPDGVLLDLMLPHMDGLQILRKTRAQKAFEKTPIIAFSNSYMNGMLQNAVEAGATMVVNKSDTGAIDNIVESFLDLLCRPSGNRFVPTPTPTATGFAEEEQVSGDSQTTQQAATSLQAAAPTTFRAPQATTRPVATGTAQRPRFGVAPVGRPRPGAVTPPQKPSAISASNTQPARPVSAPETPTGSDTASVDRSSAPRNAEQSLLEIFADKGAETMARIRTILRSYTKDPSSPDGRNHLRDLYRLVHCLTSVAGMASLESTANFSACLEALLHELLTKPGSFQPSTLRTLASAVDVLGCMFQQAGRYECPLMTEAFVLVVDDDVISQRTVTLSLQKARLGVVCASDCQEALSKLKEISFELIALDVNLPGGDGFDLCTNIRRIRGYEKIPILFVTGLNDFQSRAKSIAAGGNDFISKPLSRIEMTVRSLSYVMKGRLPITREAPQHVLV